MAFNEDRKNNKALVTFFEQTMNVPKQSYTGIP